MEKYDITVIVNPRRYSRFWDRIEKMSCFSNEGSKKIVCYCVSRACGVEVDNKGAFNKSDNVGYVNVEFYYIVKDSTEEELYESLDMEQKKNYCKVSLENNRGLYWSEYGTAYLIGGEEL